MLALRIFEAVAQVKVDEYHAGFSSDSINGSALVVCLCGSQVFSGRVRNYLLSGCVGLGLGVAIGISVGSGMVPGFIVVALCVEPEESDAFPEIFIVEFEVFSLVNIPQIGV